MGGYSGSRWRELLPGVNPEAKEKCVLRIHDAEEMCLPIDLGQNAQERKEAAVQLAFTAFDETLGQIDFFLAGRA